MKELRIWRLYTNNSFQQMLASRLGVSVFMAGKSLRVILFLIFLGFLFQGARGLGGYSREQIIFFYLTFNIVDTLAQMFFREVYRFRPLVVSGGLDFVLVKPSNPLNRVMLSGTDAFDFLMLILLSGITTIFAVNNLIVQPVNLFLYLLLLANGLLIAAALHIFTLGIGVITTSVDHLIMIYRDFTSMLRIPVDLYIEPIRSLLTFAIPLGIMITFPAKAMLGILSWQFVLLSLVFGAAGLIISLRFWNWSLQRYSSASS